MTVRISADWSFHGFRAVILENAALRIVLLPELGAKIWSKDRTDGLVADVFDLAITGAVSPAQEPLLGPRPDPNDAPAH